MSALHTAILTVSLSSNALALLSILQCYSLNHMNVRIY